ncbi:MAG TPA: hypothetical protein VE288_05585 [Rubrobacteraceae bacterium]|nr:hypothetical protein [Rubrobacteraceae bacterium]
MGPHDLILLFHCKDALHASIYALSGYLAALYRRDPGIDAARETTTLEEMIAERVVQEAMRIAEERTREMFPFAEQEPSEAKEVMDSRKAAEFLRLPYSNLITGYAGHARTWGRNSPHSPCGKIILT